MSRKLIALNLALIALAGAMVWLLRVHWLETEAHERAIFERAARARAVLPLPPDVSPRPVAAVDYLDVAQKTLFSKDRNPIVVIEPPPPKPEPPMPALPSYHGQMAIGDPVVFLSTNENAVQKSYRAGEKIGPFEVVSFDREKITFDWNGKTVERKVQDLAPKEPPPGQQQAGLPASSVPPGPRGPAPVSLAPAAVKSMDAGDKPTLGADMGAGVHGCVTGENSPSGTVKDGYKKVVAPGVLGLTTCHWEPVK